MPTATPHHEPKPTVAAAAWEIEGLFATAAVVSRDTGPAAARGRLALDHPSRGIELHGDSKTGDGVRLLGLALDPAAGFAAGRPAEPILPSDRWVRGDDLVAIYEPADPRSLRATAMWRRWPSPTSGVSAWELVVSCQTSLLESDATVRVRSVVPAETIAVPSAAADGWRWSDASAALDARQLALDARKLNGGPSATALLARDAAATSFLVAVHPLDARRLALRPADADGRLAPRVACIECRFFSTVVEKGVLLRGRSLAAVGPRDGDVEWARRLLESFNASPAPLTA